MQANDFVGQTGLTQLPVAGADKRLHSASTDTVANDFEAMFVAMMLKAARESGTEDGLFDSSEEQTYREMLDQQVAQTLARQHDFGISSVLAQQFRQMQGIADNDPGLDDLNRAARFTHNSMRLANSLRPPDTSNEVRAQPSADPSAFIDMFAADAQAAAAALGVAPGVLLAQAALETGWGAHVIRHPDGRSSHNYFGIKADASWRGEVVNVPTTEYVGGRAHTVNAAFRAYSNATEAFADYVKLISGNPRYHAAIEQRSDPHRYASALANAGYATDPAYAQKIISILDGSLSGTALPAGTKTR